MIRIVVLYPQSEGNWFNMDYYKKNHIPLARKILTPFGLEKVELDAGIAGMNGPAPYFAIAYLTFKTMEQFRKGMEAGGKALMDDVPNYTRDVIIQIGETVTI